VKITVFELEDWERSAFEPLDSGDNELELLADPLSVDNATEYADAEVISTFIYSRLDRPVLEKLDHLKLIATRSTGYDHIDLDYCAERGIAVANVPTYGENTVAEHVFGLLLVLSHKLDQAIDRTRKGDFSPRGLQGFDLQGRTMGVIGTGNIGQHVARIARGFEMCVVAFDVKPDPEAADRLGFEYVEFDELLRRSDVISLHVPLNDKTRNLISHEQFERMKPGVVIINTSRGSVVDARALIRALAEGKVAGAGIDVLAEEPVIREEAELLRSVYERSHDLEALLADHVLIRLRNVVVTPHSAFNTREAVGRILDTTVENISACLRGEALNVVNDVPVGAPR
jgi:D-lactate dehydrogenase